MRFLSVLARYTYYGFDPVGPSHSEQYTQERCEQIKAIVHYASSRYVLPLYLIFLIPDYFYYNKFFLEFLSIRIASIFMLRVVSKSMQSKSHLSAIQNLATCFVLCCALPINIMLLIIGDYGSPYYAGLILAFVGVSAGVRFTLGYYLINVGMIFMPFIVFGTLHFPQYHNEQFFLNLLFILSMALVCTTSRNFNEVLFIKEFNSRTSLEKEVQNRDTIILEKTNESVKLLELTQQFSPQVVDSIKNGKINIHEYPHKSNVCVIFVDIVNSTDRVNHLDGDQVNKILSMYMEDVMGIMLKYDVTIDKFLGDGVLGFCNDPMQYPDYIERVLLTGLEIKTRIESRQTDYNRFWIGDFKVRLGISSGPVTVGFYGSGQYFKNYTSIGTPVNLASRACSKGAPNEILVSTDIVEQVRQNKNILNFQFEDKGTFQLKGFDGDPIRLYALIDGDVPVLQSIEQFGKTRDICPKCSSGLVLEQDQNGFYQYRCRKCNHILTLYSKHMKTLDPQPKN